MKKTILTKALALSLLFSSALTLTNAQNICIKKQKNLGGSGDDFPTSTINVPGGYVICGYTNSADGSFNVPANHDFDGFISKYNYGGQIIWKHTYGGTAYDDFYNVTTTSDGGYIACGETASNDGDVSGNHGGDLDIWVVKFNSLGLIQWQHCYGGSGTDATNGSIIKAPLGYIISGATNSNDGDVSGNHGGNDAYILRISNNGTLISSHCFGGTSDDDAISIIRNSNGTYTFNGDVSSNDGDASGNHGGFDTWLVNINNNYTINWQYSLGGSGDEYPHAMVQTIDGKIIVGGPTDSNDGDVGGGNGGLFFAWLLKVNPITGNIIWNKTFKRGSSGCLGLIATNDGGVVNMGGTSDNASDADSAQDVWVFKVSSSGNMEWEKIIGGSNQDDVNFWLSGIQHGNQYIVSLPSASNDGDVQNAHGGVDGWIVTLSNCCNNHRDDFASENIFSLRNYPNPFSNSTTIFFSLDQSEKVSLKIFDVNGRLIKTIADNVFEEGEHQINFDAEKINAGIYFLKMQAGEFLKTEKLIITK